MCNLRGSGNEVVRHEAYIVVVCSEFSAWSFVLVKLNRKSFTRQGQDVSRSNLLGASQFTIVLGDPKSSLRCLGFFVPLIEAEVCRLVLIYRGSGGDFLLKFEVNNTQFQNVFGIRDISESDGKALVEKESS